MVGRRRQIRPRQPEMPWSQQSHLPGGLWSCEGRPPSYLYDQYGHPASRHQQHDTSTSNQISLMLEYQRSLMDKVEDLFHRFGKLEDLANRVQSIEE